MTESRHYAWGGDGDAHHAPSWPEPRSRCPCGCAEADNGTEDDPVLALLRALDADREAFRCVEEQIEHVEVRHYSRGET